jgi:NAD(P)-dependent dehydrogenase (short-subunit alcohol dehydrogenase family)
MMSRPFSFLITGGSSGLGLNLALAALRSGHKVIATARNVTKAKQASPEVENLGGSWLTLDVTSPDTEIIVKSAVEEYGVNVLVNSAGYALLGAVEDMEYVCEITKRQYWTKEPRYLKDIATNDALQ